MIPLKMELGLSTFILDSTENGKVVSKMKSVLKKSRKKMLIISNIETLCAIREKLKFFLLHKRITLLVRIGVGEKYHHGLEGLEINNLAIDGDPFVGMDIIRNLKKVNNVFFFIRDSYNIPNQKIEKVPISLLQIMVPSNPTEKHKEIAFHLRNQFDNQYFDLSEFSVVTGPHNFLRHPEYMDNILSYISLFYFFNKLYHSKCLRNSFSANPNISYMIHTKSTYLGETIDFVMEMTRNV